MDIDSVISFLENEFNIKFEKVNSFNGLYYCTKLYEHSILLYPNHDSMFRIEINRTSLGIPHSELINYDFDHQELSTFISRHIFIPLEKHFELLKAL